MIGTLLKPSFRRAYTLVLYLHKNVPHKKKSFVQARIFVSYKRLICCVVKKTFSRSHFYYDVMSYDRLIHECHPRDDCKNRQTNVRLIRKS